MRKETIEIMGKVFNYNGEMTKLPSIISRGIYSCYSRPSATKVKIWGEWCKYFRQFYDEVIGIRSYNVRVFTIHATFAYKGNRYYVVIFPTHNECWKIA